MFNTKKTACHQTNSKVQVRSCLYRNNVRLRGRKIFKANFSLESPRTSSKFLELFQVFQRPLKLSRTLSRILEVFFKPNCFFLEIFRGFSKLLEFFWSILIGYQAFYNFFKIARAFPSIPETS